MADVFISFIHEEQHVARAIQHLLAEHLKKEVFLSADDWQVFAGELWLDRMRLELTEAKAVVLMLSPRSVRRPWINFEAGAAWLAGKAVIPVCFGGLKKERMPKPYSGMQGVELPGDAYYLFRSVLHYVEPGAFPPPPFPPDQPEIEEIEAALGGHPYLRSLPKIGES